MLINLILSVVSGVLYRLGGIGRPFKTWMRDWTIPLVWLIGFWTLFGFHLIHWWVYLCIWLLMGGALTTYWDEVFKYDNFYAHGFMIGLATFPCIFIGIPLYVVCLYSVLLGAGMGLWSKFIGWDILEEFGRGVLICLLFLIFRMR